MGQEIGERYQLQDELGAGGMGTVFRGLDKQTGETVAIKQLKPEIVQADIIERFQREGEALRELNHPNMVKLLDTVEEEDNHYLILEYVSGGDLKSLLEKGELPIEQILMIAIQIADALTRAHFLNIIHRDLKPANILIAEDGTPLLTDFGVARVVSKERITETNAIIGTIDYLAPEVFGENEVDNRIDIWAFGVVLFEMLAAEKPFTGNSMAQLVFEIMSGDIPDLEELRDDVPIALVDLVYRMLEKDPNQRVPSVRNIGADLEAILQGRNLHTPAETRFATPIPESFERPRHNLPAQTTQFVGREAELTELARLINDPNTRLVTLVAAGGMGKTRLSLEAAKQQIDNFANGVYVVELAPLSDPQNIISAVADATAYQFQADGGSLKNQVLDYLSNKSMLLIFDNFEHLLDGASLVTDILNAAPNLQILATSRQRLNQSGESIFNLGGMDLPEWETPEDALEYAAIKLFLQSAKRVQAHYEITADNMDAIARVCMLVQGMPLGILLAASWLSMLSVEEIAEEIAQGIDFLESELSDLPERHRSIRAVFDYSWNLMSDTERNVFMKLSVFRGGFTRESAQIVAGANLRTLMSLMNKSLIHRDVDSGRYKIHEFLRQYAYGQLELSASEDTARLSHMHYFSGRMADYAEDLKGSLYQLKTLNTIETELENMRAAWSYGLLIPNLEALNKMIDGFYLFFTIRSDQHTRDMVFGDAHHKLAAQGLDAEQPIMARILIRHRSFIRQHPDKDSLIASLIETATAQDDILELAFCYYIWGATLLRSNLKQAFQHYAKSISYYEQVEQSYYLAVVLNTIGYGYQLSGDVENFISFNERSLTIAQQSSDRFGEAFAYWQLGLANLMMGKFERAEIYQQNALKLRLEMHHRMGILWCKAMLAHIRSFTNEFEQARTLAEEALAIANDLNVNEGKAEANIALAFALNLLGYHEEALKHCEEARAITKDPIKINLTIPGIYSSIQLALGDYDEAIQTSLQVLRSTVPALQGLRATAIPIFAAFLMEKGEPVRAAELMGMWHSHPRTSCEEFPVYKKLEQSIQDSLGVADFNRAYERGASFDFEMTVQELLKQFRDKL